MRYVLAEYATPAQMIAAARALEERGYRDIDTHSPFPVEGVDEAIGLRRSRVPIVCCLGGILGAVTGYLMQWWCNGVDYPINVGNRPPLGPGSLWLPNAIPITFELMVLLGSLGAFLSVFAFARLPQPYHPVFDLDRFRSASIDHFWVSVPVEEARVAETERLLEGTGASHVASVIDREEARKQVSEHHAAV